MGVFFRPFTIITDGLRRLPLTPAERLYYYYVFRVFFAVIALIVQYILARLLDNTFFTNPRTWITELVFIVLYAIQTGIKQWFSIQGSVKGGAFMENVTNFEKGLQDKGKIPTPENTYHTLPVTLQGPTVDADVENALPFGKSGYVDMSGKQPLPTPPLSPYTLHATPLSDTHEQTP